MATPWTEGSNHSGIYFIKNCSVEKEFIQIKIVKGQEETEAEFTITYHINANSDKIVPLVFIGRGLYGGAKVIVNGQIANQIDIIPSKETFLKENLKGYNIKFSKGEDHAVDIEDLLYFNAHFQKGKNLVVVKYRAQMKYDRRDFIKEYILEYSLYPSNFWETFGPIEVALEPGEEIKLLNSSLGEPILKNKNYFWTVTDKSKDISIEFSPKYSWLTKSLIAIGPFGLACLISSLLLYFNITLIKKRRINHPLKFNFWVPVGTIINCIVFNSTFIFSFYLFNWLTTETKSGYFILAVFVFVPLFLLSYSTIVWAIDVHFKRKFLK